VVGIATGQELDDRKLGVRVPVGSRIFSSPRRTDRHWGPSNLLSDGYRGAPSPGVTRLDREAHHSPPASAEVKVNVNLYIRSPIRLHGVVFNSQAQGQLYLYSVEQI
jgi:hypothetical protein